ncbi:MAG TPA: hypothetical protein VGD65_25845 [Chryseosolibacter sp.]
MIKLEFFQAISKYTSRADVQQAMWEEIEKNYSGSRRHYHTISHLDSMLAELIIHQPQFDNWDTIVFAISYHDIIYNSLKSDNEERSAAIAVKRLKAIGFPAMCIDFCSQLILTTKKHEPRDVQTNLFTDADLSILGSDSARYAEYTRQIRKEYSIYPDIIYNRGRVKVLKHFLAMDSIYKTKAFADLYEEKARANIEAELAGLQL